MAELRLRDGQIAIVDDGDLAYLSQWQWSWSERIGVLRYDADLYDATARRTPHVIMHRLITRASPELVVHHVDGNRLNHRRTNLLLLDHAAHVQRIQRPRGESPYLGVSRKGLRWQAQIAAEGGEGGTMSLGVYATEEEAATAYDAAALARYGPSATLNFPQPFFICPGCHRAYRTLRDAPFHNSACRVKSDLRRW